jgi:hypothetical protein
MDLGFCGPQRAVRINDERTLLQDAREDILHENRPIRAEFLRGHG